MTRYYFLATALPPIQLGVVPEMRFQELVYLLETNLNKRDFADTAVIRRYYDIQNIRSFWKKEPLDPYGNLDEVELEEALLTREGLPVYIFDFIDKYDSIEKRVQYFAELVATYFRKEIRYASSPFLKAYLTFEREWRLVLTGFRAKQLGRDLTQELQFEDPDDDFIAQILAQKDSKEFIAPDGYQDLQSLFEIHSAKPLELYQALCEYRFYAIEEILKTDLFSLDRILGYMSQLIMAEKWIELNQQKGLELADQLFHHVTV